MILFLKLCIFAVVVRIIYVTGMVVWSGKRAQILQSTESKNEHRDYRMRLSLAFVILIAFVELLVRYENTSLVPDIGPFLIFHWVLDAFLLLEAGLLVFVISGKKSPKYHAPFVHWVFLPTLAGVLITGLLLTVQA